MNLVCSIVYITFRDSTCLIGLWNQIQVWDYRPLDQAYVHSLGNKGTSLSFFLFCCISIDREGLLSMIFFKLKLLV